MGIRKAALESVTCTRLDCGYGGARATRGAKGPLTTAISKVSATPVLAATDDAA